MAKTRTAPPGAKKPSKAQKPRKAKAATASAATPLNNANAGHAGPALNGPQQPYDGASSGRRLRGWRAQNVGPNAALTNVQTLRDRSRDLARNDWIGRAARTRWGASLVGTGILARPRTQTAELRQSLIDLWDDFATHADADGNLDLYGLQHLAATTLVVAGECFIRLRPRRLSDGLTVPLQIQILEPEFVPLFDLAASTTDQNHRGETLPAGHRIASGIEFNRIGRKVAYWMHRQHPADANLSNPADTWSLVRVPAAQVMHLFEPERPGQLRGIPGFAAVLAKLRGVGNYDDAVLSRQEIANLITGFITKPPALGQRLDPLTGQPIPDNAGLPPISGLEPATLNELAPGEDIKFSSPPDAGTNYGDYMRAQHQFLSAGLGIPYELLTGDVRDVSDRTLRVVIQEFRRLVQQRQWLCLIPQMCAPIRRAWANACLIAGRLTLDQIPDALAVDWAPQGWDYLHPVQDVDAQIKKVSAGFKTRSAVILESGDDPWAIEQELAADNARADNAGLTLTSDSRHTGPAAAHRAPTPNPEPTDDD